MRVVPAPPNQRPPDVRAEELPEWARDALAKLQTARDGGHGRRYFEDGERWYVPEQGLALWARGSRVGLLLFAPALAYPVGIALLAWALLGLRSDQVVWWRWLLGAGLALVGSVGVTLLRRWLHCPPFAGLVVAPGGLLVVDGNRYRCAARKDIHRIVLEEGRLAVEYGAMRRLWRQYSATPGTPAHADLERRQRDLQAWRESGALPAPDREGREYGRPPRLVGASSKLLMLVAGLLVFGWLTLVLPATSDAGRITRQFVERVGAGDYDTAHTMLSPRLQNRMPRERFEALLPAELKAAQGFTVNGISGGVGSVVGVETCVDGWLDGVSGNSGFRFELVSDGQTQRIDAFRSGTCRRR